MPARRFEGKAKPPTAAQQAVISDLVDLAELARLASKAAGEDIPEATVRGWWYRNSHGIRDASGGFEDPPRVLWSRVEHIFTT